MQTHLLLALELMVDPQCRQTADYWGFTAEEAKKWTEVAQKIRLPRQGDLLEQFDGFFELNAIDVLQYRDTPGTLQRAYGWKEINQAQVLKQADVIMLLHLFPDEFLPRRNEPIGTSMNLRRCTIRPECRHAQCGDSDPVFPKRPMPTLRRRAG